MDKPEKPHRIIVTGCKSSGEKTEVARKLRKDMTPAEMVLWKQVRNHQLDGFKFRRQQVIQGFIADFYCHEAALAVEIDGSGHDADYDKERDEIFSGLGISVLRFTNEQVLRQLNSVIDRIRQNLKVQ
jgi:very-short-patch-repair endonuclease